MANANRGEVEFTAGGKTYTLRYTTNALCELEDALDCGLPEIVERVRDPKSVRLSTVRALVWAGLREHHPDITLLQAGTLVGEYGMMETLQKVGVAFERAFAGREGGGRPPAAAPQSGTGSSG